jgi:predicted RNase H-like HicB family nuclease
MMNLIVRVEIFRENDVFVALSPELNVSSFGDTPDEAKRSLLEAIGLFIEECDEMGTLEEVLEESGFLKEPQSWTVRQPIFEENIALAVYRERNGTEISPIKNFSWRHNAQIRVP